jgi:cytochrome bd-type quinol oxidase subunit 1
MRHRKVPVRATPSSVPSGIQLTLRSTAYDAEPMVGAALGRLWDTHPKLAFVLHLLLTAYLGALALWLFVTGATGVGVVLTIGFVVMAGSLVLFTWLEAPNGWQSDDTSNDGRGNVVSPRAAWTNTQARGRIFWVLFGVAFLAALVLLIAKSIVGIAVVFVAFVLAIIAMRTD